MNFYPDRRNLRETDTVVWEEDHPNRIFSGGLDTVHVHHLNSAKKYHKFLWVLL